MSESECPKYEILTLTRKHVSYGARSKDENDRKFSPVSHAATNQTVVVYVDCYLIDLVAAKLTINDDGKTLTASPRRRVSDDFRASDISADN